MGRGIFRRLLGSLEAIGVKVPDKRREGYNHSYDMSDAIKRVFGVFFFQRPSTLDFQRTLKEKKKWSNVDGALSLKAIPSDPQIKTLLDRIEAAEMSGVFNENLKAVEG